MCLVESCGSTLSVFDCRQFVAAIDIQIVSLILDLGIGETLFSPDFVF